MYMPGHRFDPSSNPLERLEGRERREAVPAEDVVGRLGLQSRHTVLDLGIGTGYFALPMAARAGWVLGVDIEPKMLSILSDRLRQGGAGNISLLRADMLGLPLVDGSVDRILAAFVYHEVDDKTALVRECARALVPGGSLTVVDFQKHSTAPLGPPVSIRRTSAHVIRMASQAFSLKSDFRTEVYYQLQFTKL